MVRQKQLAISERQFEVLTLLWEHGPMTVRELRERLPREGELPYTTVLALLQVMERAGLVAHEAENQAHRYRPLLTEQEGVTRLLSDFVRRFFRGAANKLVLGLIDSRQLSLADLRDLEAEFEAASRRPANASRGTEDQKRGKRRKP